MSFAWNKTWNETICCALERRPTLPKAPTIQLPIRCFIILFLDVMIWVTVRYHLCNTFLLFQSILIEQLRAVADLKTYSFIRSLPLIFILAAVYGVSFPLLAIKIEASDASARLIGMIAAMPALGWIIGSISLPSLLRICSIKSVMTGLLLFALVAWVASGWINDPLYWMPMRMVFGGAIGSFF